MKGGIIGVKKEMTRVQIDGNMVPVTLVSVDTQYLIGYRTLEKDGYESVIVGLDKKEKINKNNKKLYKYSKIKEFPVDSDWMNKYSSDSIIDIEDSMFENKVTVIGVSKGKGFSGIMKRFNASGGPKTHGSKFHRQVGSMGNRKPRRVMKGHPHAGRMGGDKVTVSDVKVLKVLKDAKETLLIIKGSVPGGYNSKLFINIV